MRVGVAVFAHTASGMEVGTVDAALGLRALGVDAVLFAEPHATLPERAAELEVVRLPRAPSAFRDARLADGLFLAAKASLARRLAVAMRRADVDLLHAFSPGAAMAVPAGVPVVVQAWQHPPALRARVATYLPFARRTPPRLIAQVARDVQSHVADEMGFRRSDLVLTTTTEAAAAMRRHGRRAVACPPPIALSERPPPRIRDAAFRIAFCGSPLDRPRKGLGHLVDALLLDRPPRPVRLDLYGAVTPGAREMAARLRGAGISVHMPGRVSREVYLDALARRTDLLVFPSLHEEWGYALVEALSRGVPAVAFARHPFTEILDADTGILARTPDAQGLARAISLATADGLPSPAEVRDSVEGRLGADAVCRRLLGIYRAVCGIAGPSAPEGRSAATAKPAP